MARHFRTRIEDSLLEYARKAAGIEREAALDGLYIVRTNETGMPAEDAVRGYQKLVRVEQAFRCLKSVDLKVRPIHHRAEWHLRSTPAPLLVQHEDPEGWQVAVAHEEPPHERRRSAVAQRLEPAAGACDARPPPVRDAERSQGSALIRQTDPTPLQKRAIELWRAFPVNSTPNPENASVIKYSRLDPQRELRPTETVESWLPGTNGVVRRYGSAASSATIFENLGNSNSLTVALDSMRCDIAAAANERFVLGHGGGIPIFRLEHSSLVNVRRHGRGY